jgi:hypothetical protein
MEVSDTFIKMQFLFFVPFHAYLASKFAKSFNESQKFRIDVINIESDEKIEKSSPNKNNRKTFAH